MSAVSVFWLRNKAKPLRWATAPPRVAEVPSGPFSASASM